MPDEDVTPSLPRRRIPLPPDWTAEDAETFVVAANQATDRWVAERKAAAPGDSRAWWYRLRDSRKRELLVTAGLWPADPVVEREPQPRRRGAPPKPLKSEEAKKLLELRAKNGKVGPRELARRMREIGFADVTEHRARGFLERHGL